MKRMTCRLVTLTFVAAALIFSAAGCSTHKTMAKRAQSPLKEWMKTYGFTSFNPPRTGDGIGAIISFNSKGEESIVAGPGECIDLGKVPPLDQPDPVAALSSEYKIEDNYSLEWAGLPKAWGTDIDLKAALKDARVEKVTIKFNQPARDRITALSLKNFVRDLTPDSSCLEEMKRKGNLVIHSVLVARGFEYGFVGSGDSKVALTLELLDAMKLTPEIAKKFDGASSLSIGTQELGQKPLLLGYRAWRVEVLPGGLTTNINVVPLTGSDIEAVRAAQTGN